MVISIAVGVAAVGVIIAARELAARQLAATLITLRPAHVMLDLNPPVGPDMLETIARLPDVAEVEGVSIVNIRWKTTPDGEWQAGRLTAREDYTAQKFFLLGLTAGAWPDSRRVGVEAGYVAKLQLPPLGSALYFEVADQPKAAPLGALIYDPGELPLISQLPMFYATPDLLADLGGTPLFVNIRFRLAGFSQARAEAAVRVVEAQLSKAGIQTTSALIINPSRHPSQDIFDAFLVILGVMGACSLALSAFLVINTLNALIAQQVPQIGVMKTIGGTTGQIAALYLSGAAAYGGLSLLLALPLGVAGGAPLANLVLATFNVSAAPFQIAWPALGYQFACGLLTPLLAALWPVWQGARISIRKAIAAYGLGTGRYGAGGLDRVLGRISGGPRMLALILRNTFRRAGRAVLTQLTLITAGATFMMVVSTQSSFDHTIASMLGAWGFDVQLSFARPQRINRLESIAAQLPEVADMEVWLGRPAKVSRPGESDLNRRHNIFITGVAADSRLFRPLLIQGRALDPHDGHAILLSQLLVKDLGVSVGDVVEIGDGVGRKQQWRVVGVVADLTNGQRTGYVPRTALSRDLSRTGEGTLINLRLRTQTEAAQEAFAERLRDVFEAQGIEVTDGLTLLKFQRQASSAFAPIAGFLLLMTVFIAVVGGFSLSSTMSINVMERRREIAVMRAVGASSFDIALIFVGEGLLLGGVSWLIALPLSLLGAPHFLNAIGATFSFPMLFQYSPAGALAWLIIVAALSLIASWIPAHSAARLSVREGLAYE